MNPSNRPFVQLAINAVDLVILDNEGQYDADHFDRYETFESARDAALTSIEVMLDAQDYDDDDHRRDLERMRDLLESATHFEDIANQPIYQDFQFQPVESRSAA